MKRMPDLQHPEVTALVEPLGCELADRFEHEEATVVGLPKKTLVQQGFECVQVGVAHLFGCIPVEATREDREPSKQASLTLAEEVVTPFDRRSQCAVALVRVPPSARQK